MKSNIIGSWYHNFSYFLIDIALFCSCFFMEVFVWYFFKRVRRVSGPWTRFRGLNLLVLVEVQKAEFGDWILFFLIIHAFFLLFCLYFHFLEVILFLYFIAFIFLS